MLLGLIIVFTNLTPLHVLDRTAISALLLAPQGVPNAAPKVIPSLREWQGNTGFFTLNTASRISVDPSYTAQLKDTARVFHDDLLTETGYALPLVTTTSPAVGDFFLTLNNLDSGIGNEGYLFQIGESVVISAHTSAGVFYGTRTALQILLQDSTKTHIPKGTARDYPQYAERGFMLDVGRKFFPISFLEDYVKFMAWYKMMIFTFISTTTKSAVEIARIGCITMLPSASTVLASRAWRLKMALIPGRISANCRILPERTPSLLRPKLTHRPTTWLSRNTVQTSPVRTCRKSFLTLITHIPTRS